MNLFNSEKLIKIPGKTYFDELSIYEIGLMIEADSSISEDGNSYFSSCALDEFLYSKLTRADLIEIQGKILNGIYIDIKGSKNKKINVEFLEKFAEELKVKGDEK